MKNWKRWMAFLLVMCLVLPLVPNAGAASLPFRDVPENEWYHEYVAYAYENSLMQGTGASTFEPESSLTRAMFVTILGRIDGADTSAYGSAGFTDVPGGQWYTPYIAWAAEKGITVGNGDGTFGTEKSVTREEMAVMIARYIDACSFTLPATANPPKGFRDLAVVSEWAMEGLELMRRTGLIVGDKTGAFNPKNTATRAEAATIFMRLNRAISVALVESVYEVDGDHVQVDESEKVRYVDNILLVFLEDGVSQEQREALAESVGGTIAGQLADPIGMIQIQVDPTDLAGLRALAEQLMESEKVTWASFDVPYYTAEMGANSYFDLPDGTADGDANGGWWYDAVEANDVRVYYGDLFDTPKIGVIDAGILPQQRDLEGKVTFVDRDFRQYNDSMIQNPDCAGAVAHGTGVASIAAGYDDGTGTTGIAPNAQVVFGNMNKEYEDAWGTTVTVIHILNGMVRDHGARVINGSFGYTLYSEEGLKKAQANDPSFYPGRSYDQYLTEINADAVYTSLIYAIGTCSLIRSVEEEPEKYSDFLIVQAAGNGYDGAGNVGVNSLTASGWAGITEENSRHICQAEGVSYDLLSSHYLIVGAVENDKLGYTYNYCTGTNYGEYVDIWAPGIGLYIPGSLEEYILSSGTSLATPIVSGTAALVWGIKPDLTAGEVQQILLENYSYEARGITEVSPAPVVNTRMAVEAALNMSDRVIGNGTYAVRRGDTYYYWDFSTGYSHIAEGDETYHLIRWDDSGREVLYTSSHRSRIWIAGDRLLLSEREKNGSNVWVVSMPLDGGTTTLVGGMCIEGMDEATGLLILCNPFGGASVNGYYYYDPAENQSVRLPVSYSDTSFIRTGMGSAYFGKSSSDYKTVTIMEYDLFTGRYASISSATITSSQMNAGCSVLNSWKTGDYFYYVYGWCGGSANVYQGGGLNAVNKATMEKVEVTTFKADYTVDVPKFYVFRRNNQDVLAVNANGSTACAYMDSKMILPYRDPIANNAEPTMIIDGETKSCWGYLSDNGEWVQLVPEVTPTVSGQYVFIENVTHTGRYVFYDLNWKKDRSQPAAWWDTTVTFMRRACVFDLVTGETEILCTAGYDAL